MQGYSIWNAVVLSLTVNMKGIHTSGVGRDPELSDNELIRRLLCGDKVLLGQFLANDCFPTFCKFANDYKILKLEPQDILSLACKQMLESNMSLVRSYNPQRWSKAQKEGYHQFSTAIVERKNCFKNYVLSMVKRRLGKLAAKASIMVGDGKHIRSHDGISCINLDNENIKAAAKNLEDLQVSFQTTAFDLNLMLTALPEQQRNIVVMYKLQGYTAKEIGDILHIDASIVYSETAKAMQNLKIIAKSKNYACR
ncbi:MAG: sigma-70 family RNA polymerase sigma factor [Akkermansiaceae bacterium]|nr:sigma-70 family RNA polymerase sigma factor [Akkermansiaceae bacterium]